MPNAIKIPSASKITRVSQYKANDGVNFDTAKDAQIHNLGLTMRTALMEQGFRDDGLLKQICLTLAKKHGTFKPIYTALNNAQAMKS